MFDWLKRLFAYQKGDAKTYEELDIDEYRQEFKLAILTLILPDLIAKDEHRTQAQVSVGTDLTLSLGRVSDYMRHHWPKTKSLHPVHEALVKWLRARQDYTSAYVQKQPPRTLQRLEEEHQDQAVRFIRALFRFDEEEGNGIWIEPFLGAELATTLCRQFSGIRVTELAPVDTSLDTMITMTGEIAEQARSSAGRI